MHLPVSAFADFPDSLQRVNVPQLVQDNPPTGNWKKYGGVLTLPVLFSKFPWHCKPVLGECEFNGLTF